MPRSIRVFYFACSLLLAAFVAGCGTTSSTGAGQPIQVTVSPTTASLQVGTSQQFSATVTGTSNTTAVWSVNGIVGGNATIGTVSSTGLYTAPPAVPSPATVTVAGTSQADTSKSATAQVTVTALTAGAVLVTVSPTTASLQVGASQQFIATVTGTSNTNVVWNVNGIVGGNATIGTVSSSGLYAAPAAVPSPATVTVTGTSQADTSKSATAQVTVTSGSSNPSIAISPAGASLSTGGTQTFSAAVTGVSNPVIQWTASNGTLSSSTGSSVTYTAPSAAGAYTITASVPSASLSQTVVATVLGASSTGVYLYPVTATIPVQGIQSFTVYFGGTTNQGVSWSSSPSSLTFVGSTSSNTVGVRSAVAGTFVITAKSLADNTKTASATVTFEPVRPDLQASATHPRVWLTAADVADLQTKTTGTNLMWSQGVQSYFTNQMASYASAHFCFASNPTNCTMYQADGVNKTYSTPPGTPDAKWLADDPGAPSGGTVPGDTAVSYAYMSLIDPVTANRATWAAHAHDIIIWEFATACGITIPQLKSGTTGPCSSQNGVGYRDPYFALSNRSQSEGQEYGEAVDWVYSTFTTTEKQLMVNLFHMWGKNLLTLTLAGAEIPMPVGAVNNPSTLSDVGTIEWSANNFAVAHYLVLASIGLALDPADDPNINSCPGDVNTICSDGSANTVRAYIRAALGAYLYRIYANFENPSIVSAAYGLSDPYKCPGMNGLTESVECFGAFSEGMSGEGSGYSPLSMDILFRATFMLYQAGKLDPGAYPQASFISSSFWDKLFLAEVLSLEPSPLIINSNNQTFWRQWIYGDHDHDIVVNNQVNLFRAMLLYDTSKGNLTRRNSLKWYEYNVGYYGWPSYLSTFILGGISTPGSGLEMMEALNNSSDGDFQNTSPYSNVSANQYDPRSTLPLEINRKLPYGFYRYEGRTDWSATAAGLDFFCDAAYINHAHGICGKFDYYRKGEPLIYGEGGYTGIGESPHYNNMAAYQWNPGFNCNTVTGVDIIACQEGGQSTNSQAFGSAFVRTASSNSSYYFGSVDSTKAHGVGSNISSFIGSSITRDLLWIKPDFIITYDRGDTTLPAFKRWYIDTTGAASVSGATASFASPKGQRLFVTAVLPASATLSFTSINSVAGNSPVVGYLKSDAGSSSSVRMLHVIQGADAGGGAVPVTLTQSTSGTAFDGAYFGNTAAMFINSVSAAFGSTTYSVPASVTQNFVLGLLPNTSYTISSSVSGTNKLITISSSPGSATTDSAGVLVFTTP